MNIKKPQTNVQLVTDFMEFGRQGALNQAFLIEAVNFYAKTVINQEDDFIANMQNCFINPAAWVACAKEWQGKIAARK